MMDQFGAGLRLKEKNGMEEYDDEEMAGRFGSADAPEPHGGDPPAAQSGVISHIKTIPRCMPGGFLCAPMMVRGGLPRRGD